NDTTGKDCVRYGFRQNFYGETAANAIGPVLVKAFGKGKKAAFMTPDYTYGHTVTKSVNDYMTKNGGWTQVTNQGSPLGTQDFSQYLTNIANSGADVIVNVNWGRDAVLSVQQAKQFGLTPKMQMVIPYQIPFLAKEAGPELMEGVYAATDFWWTLEDKYPLAKMFVEAFDKKYGYKPEWGANNAYMSFAIWARMVSNAGSFYPPDVIKEYEKGEKFDSTVGEVFFRKEDHQLVRPVVIVKGKAPKAMRNKEDFWEVTEVVPGAPLMQKPDAFGCNLGDYNEQVLSWAKFGSQLFNGLALGALLALIAAGLTIIYGTLGVLNLAHGAMFMLGGYAGCAAYQATGSFVAGLAVGTLAVGALGIVLERVIIRHFYPRPHEDQLLVTFGLAIVFVEAVRWLFSSESKTVQAPQLVSGITNLGFMSYPTYRLAVVGICAVALLTLFFVLYRTRLGMIVRAGIEDAEMVDSLGINVDLVFMTVFGIGA